MEKISLKDYLKQDNAYNDVPELSDSDMLSSRFQVPLYRQFIDIQGEVIHCLDIYKKYKKRKTDEQLKNNLNRQIDQIHKLCRVVYLNDDISEYYKEELKVAEWSLYDYMLWGNNLNYNAKGVTAWFDEWLYSLDRSLIKANC